MELLDRAKQATKVLLNLRRRPGRAHSKSKFTPRSSGKEMSVSTSAPTSAGSRFSGPDGGRDGEGDRLRACVAYLYDHVRQHARTPST